jgi:FKBP-type peptidyl-prolyl cis-trans isomerase SlyD
MQISSGHVVSFHYTLRAKSGAVLDSSVGKPPLSYLHGHQPLNIAGLEEGLSGRSAGDEVDLELPPSQTFGEHDPQKVQAIPREAFPATATLQQGARYTTTTPDGKELSFTIMELQPETIVVDFNHPLAGQVTVLSVKVEEVRHATPEEIQNGRVS